MQALFSSVQYSFSNDGQNMVETLVLHVRDPKDLIQVSMEDSASAISSAAAWSPRILPSVGSGWNVSENRQSLWRAAQVRKTDLRRTRAPMNRYFAAVQKCLPTIGGLLGARTNGARGTGADPGRRIEDSRKQKSGESRRRKKVMESLALCPSVTSGGHDFVSRLNAPCIEI